MQFEEDEFKDPDNIDLESSSILDEDIDDELGDPIAELDDTEALDLGDDDEDEPEVSPDVI